MGILSKTTTKEQQNYSAFKGEAYAQQAAYQQFKHMMPPHSEIYTDQRSLTYMLESNRRNPALAETLEAYIIGRRMPCHDSTRMSKVAPKAHGSATRRSSSLDIRSDGSGGNHWQPLKVSQSQDQTKGWD